MYIKGIDVSYHQNTIDWSKVDSDGIEFAIIRAGYGTKTTDTKFVENITNADKAGLSIGVYWFIYAANEAEAILNAKKCISSIAPYKSKIKMKVWADWEYDSDKRNPQTKESRTNIVEVFCKTLKDAGYDVGVYANPDYILYKFDMKVLDKYPLWLAKYSTDNGGFKCFMWQHSSRGSVRGIIGAVDLNILYGALPIKPYPTLREGSRNEYVKILQKKFPHLRSEERRVGKECGL